MNKLGLIHPDPLLDRARRGALAPGEWQQLGAHLAACAPCAWEQAAAADFEREQAGMQLGDLGGDAGGQLDRLVDGALARAGLALAPEVTPRVEASSRGRARAGSPWRLRPGRWLAAAAMVAAAVGAAMMLPARSPREGTRVDPPLASTEVNLDAGALGAGIGGDS